MAEERHNMRNSAVKRILQEVKEMQNSPSDDYASLPLEDDIFEWHFAIRGPEDTEFEGGIYHGRIQLPPDYPFVPPAFMLLTPNGRFETQTKICLSISQHHPEHWQPSWSVRTALVALIAFLPTKPDGALGSLDYTKEERHSLAVKSRAAPPKFGNAERQKLIDEIHEQLLKKSPPVPELSVVEPTTSMSPVPAEEAEAVEDDSGTDGDSEAEIVENVHEVHVNANAGPIAVSFTAGFRMATRAPTAQQVGNVEVVDRAAAAETEGRPAPGVVTARRHSLDDRGLTFLAIALTIAIVALLVKKFLKSSGAFDQAPSHA